MLPKFSRHIYIKHSLLLLKQRKAENEKGQTHSPSFGICLHPAAISFCSVPNNSRAIVSKYSCEAGVRLSIILMNSLPFWERANIFPVPSRNQASLIPNSEQMILTYLSAKGRFPFSIIEYAVCVIPRCLAKLVWFRRSALRISLRRVIKALVPFRDSIIK